MWPRLFQHMITKLHLHQVNLYTNLCIALVMTYLHYWAKIFKIFKMMAKHLNGLWLRIFGSLNPNLGTLQHHKKPIVSCRVVSLLLAFFLNNPSLNQIERLQFCSVTAVWKELKYLQRSIGQAWPVKISNFLAWLV